MHELNYGLKFIFGSNFYSYLFGSQVLGGGRCPRILTKIQAVCSGI